MALVSLILYSAAAIWMTIGLQYELGDALARVADARYMLFSRDPHLAAVGMYWMPLPVIGQLPFMLVLSPLHRAELSGPLGCAFAGALSLLVLARICRDLGLSKWVAIGFTLVYALNPIMIWTAGNGMSEEWSYLGLLIALLGYVRWCKRHRPLDLATLAIGLVVVMLVRYEALALAPILGIAAALNDGGPLLRRRGVRQILTDVRRRLPRSARVFGVVVLPTYYIFALWTLVEYVIQRDPFYWVKQQRLSGHTSSSYHNLPGHLTLATIVVFALTTTLAVCPALAIVGPMLVGRRRLARALPGAGILAGALLWPAIVALGLVARESAGTTRYFEPAIVFITVGALWLVSEYRPPHPQARRTFSLALIGLLGISTVVSTIALTSPKRSYIEREDYVIGRLVGQPVRPLLASDTAPSMVHWRQLARDLDPQLAHGSRVLIDATVDFEAFIFSRYPNQYIVDSDRDYLPILADPAGRFDYLIQSTNTFNVGPRVASIATIIADTSNGHWVKWRTYPQAIVYHLVPTQAGPK